MKLGLASGSLLLFGLAVVSLLALTWFESSLVGLSLGTERLLTVLLLVLPAGIGAVLGALSLIHKEGRAWMALTGLMLNILFALFHLLLVLFAG